MIRAASWMARVGQAAREAAQYLPRCLAQTRNEALLLTAAYIRADIPAILAANQLDLAGFAGKPGLRDRLLLDEPRVLALARSVERVARLPDPLSRNMGTWTADNGLRIARVAAPIGVIGMIYESRPAVGVEAAALCVKSGNAVMLRGGSDCLHSALRLQMSVLAALSDCGLPQGAVQMAASSDRELVGAMLRARGLIDLLIPRGGKSLIERVLSEARVPVLAHAEGINHTYVHAAADLNMARRIVVNAKMRRPAVCGATETLLIDDAVASAYLPLILGDLAALGCEFRADERAREIMPHLPPAAEADFRTEWQAAIMSVAVVNGLDAAMEHIARYGSQHTDAIVTNDAPTATRFLREVDSALTLWNASTQFNDGGELGYGAEIGISTSRLHARGPIGLEQLTTYRHCAAGTGQVRT